MPEVAAIAGLLISGKQAIDSADAAGKAKKEEDAAAAAQASMERDLKMKRSMHTTDLLAARFRNEALSRQRRMENALGTAGTKVTGAYGLSPNNVYRKMAGVL